MKKLPTYLLYVVPAILLFTYIGFRSALVPLVHDEAETFFIYMVNGDFLPYQGYISANNHFLNSFAGYVCFKLFGPESFWIRLPNLLSFAVYLIYGYLLLRSISKPLVRQLIGLCLITAPFVIEFFGLARGYGMSLAFLLAFLFYFRRYFSERLFQDWLKSIFFILLALAASLTLFHIFLLSIGLFILDLLLSSREKRDKPILKAIILVLFGIVPSFFIVKYVRYLGTINELVVTGNEPGFYVNTVEPLLQQLVMTDNLTAHLLVLILFFSATLISAIRLIRSKPAWRIVIANNTALVFLVFCLLNIAFVGYFMGIPFARDRAVLFLVPLFYLSLATSFDQLNLRPGLVRFSMFPLIFVPVSFLATANFTHSMYWKNKRIPHRYYDYIASHQGDELLTIGSMSLRETIWYHTIFSTDQKLNPLYIEDVESDLSTDYKILPDTVNPRLTEAYTKVDEDLISGNNLYERKSKLGREKIWQEDVIPFKGSDMYYNLVDIQPLHFPLSVDLLLETEFILKASEVPIEFSLVLEIRDKNDRPIQNQAIRLSRMKYHWNKQELTKLVFTIGKIQAEANRLLLYLYNNNEAAYDLQKGSVKIYKLVEDNS